MGAFKPKPASNDCTPTDDEKKAAGGDGVLTFAKDDSGNCVAESCNTVAGYTLSQGVCSKAADVNPYNDKTVTCKGNTTDYFRMVDGKLRNYGTPEIATSWDKDWQTNGKTNVIPDCSIYDKGHSMPAKP